MARFVIAATGASGIILTYRTMLALTAAGFDVDLVMTQSAVYTATLELGKNFGTPQKLLLKLPENLQKKVRVEAISDVGASICSGSYPTSGMIIIPCSMSTLAALRVGLADNALRRAADVTVKEKRPLIIVPRETPLSEIHLENMLALSRRGATILPPIPGWYANPKSLEEMENFIVGKVLDVLKIEHDLYKKWKSGTGTGRGTGTI